MWYNGFEVKSVNKQQTHKERVSRQSRDLQFGDIVGICAPFEENLPDYYNGYNPLDVRGDYVTDGFGRTYKFRPVMVVGVSETELHFVRIEILQSVIENINTNCNTQRQIRNTARHLWNATT